MCLARQLEAMATWVAGTGHQTTLKQADDGARVAIREHVVDVAVPGDQLVAVQRFDVEVGALDGVLELPAPLQLLFCGLQPAAAMSQCLNVCLATQDLEDSDGCDRIQEESWMVVDNIHSTAFQTFCSFHCSPCTTHPRQ